MSTWHWVRHGPTHQKAFTGWRDVPADLSDVAALARLNAVLPEGALLVASDLTRASATADALAVAGRTRLPDEPALREFDFGAWDGQTFDTIAARWPDLSRAYWEDPGPHSPPEGESWNAAAARVEAAVAALEAAHPGATFIAVAHIGTILTQYARAAGLSPLDAIAQNIAPLSVTTLRRAPPEVLRVNHAA
ncbi:histidine phosphatase family protein [Pseudoroseicyclus tamaricis]|uniref:Histidine phosphatase family protein n=1 Tax=Pseudoroseicyclus tamaricis TaxID=2705421 RepID=A0A6B2JVA5_9RHOB|nr:histidine phosphatase family protein [Pseudoroseicyclus tamaricis]NDV00114.1 histidine phosphatase family protein [Pseudoroseicyclus tamaricis]